jgi:hypothetical protein
VKGRVLTGEVLEWRRGRWCTVKLGNVTVRDRRRVFDDSRLRVTS